MSNNNDTIQHARDMQELEGTLLPVATEVTPVGNNNNAATNTSVIPCAEAVFDYATALCNETQPPQPQQQQLEQATVLPDAGSRHNYAGVSDDSKSAVGLAKRNGQIESHKELDAIRKANTKVYSHNYHSTQAIKNANAFAQQRDREELSAVGQQTVEFGGLERERLLQKEQEESTVAPIEQPNKEQELKEEPKGYQPKGYQVKEYDVNAYETKEYDVKEYKSVYD